MIFNFNFKIQIQIQVQVQIQIQIQALTSENKKGWDRRKKWARNRTKANIGIFKGAKFAREKKGRKLNNNNNEKLTMCSMASLLENYILPCFRS